MKFICRLIQSHTGRHICENVYRFICIESSTPIMTFSDKYPVLCTDDVNWTDACQTFAIELVTRVEPSSSNWKPEEAAINFQEKPQALNIFVNIEIFVLDYMYNNRVRVRMFWPLMKVLTNSKFQWINN